MDLHTDPEDSSGLNGELSRKIQLQYLLSYIFYFSSDFVSHIQTDALRSVWVLLAKGYPE